MATTIAQTIEVYRILMKQFSEEEALTIIDFVESLKKGNTCSQSFVLKQDIFALRNDLKRFGTRLIWWIVGVAFLEIAAIAESIILIYSLRS